MPLTENQDLNEKTRLPRHIAIIMDGNGRWAEQRGMERIRGHFEGAKAVERISRFAADELKISYLTLFAFSTENWKRPSAEVRGLIDLLFDYLKKEPDELQKRNVRLRFIGRLDDFHENIREEINKAINNSQENSGLQLTVALSYGGRQEILQAVQAISDEVSAGSLTLEEAESFDEEDFRAFFYAPDLPDPDIIIRTGGEQRISNFFLWQAANAFFWSTSTLWPDFRESDLQDAIKAYQMQH
ncbi:di-trans,poly-cis-decaprenylcistransferase [Candidatus Acetothermia bacterium]|nr:di-trans,poly-cis-decaprenylcistransferase [Candidatus Acetothermia bacterium]MBI3643047.1 di-trans,poly-cis-decaprenylcistransferase [Candidatus Acetothermia bacterium]